MTLPRPDRRAHLQGFALVMAAGFGLLSGGITSATNVRHPWMLAGAFALVVVASIGGNEAVGWRLYRGWNRYLARPVARLAEATILRVCFFVIRATGAAGGSTAGAAFRQRPAGWLERRSLPGERFERLFFPKARTGRGAAPGVAEYRAWAAGSGHGWAVCLLPFLTLLRWVGPEEEKAAATNIYTLF